MRYPWQLLNRIVGHLEVQQIDAAHADLDHQLDIIASAPSRLDLRKLRCAQVMCFCSRGALAAAAPSSELVRDQLQALDALANARSWQASRKLMHAYLDQLFALIRRERRTDVQRFIEQVRSDMRQTLETPRTLRQYADMGGISVGHLSRAFTEAAGLPFRKELRRVRIAEARKLLTSTPLKISVVARRVGLRDTSQFIADFRAEVGVTPGQFRQRVARRKNRAANPNADAGKSQEQAAS